MKRLIDANKLISALYHHEHDVGGIDAYTAQDIINSEPTIDAVEVVRCKECKHWDTADGECYADRGIYFPKADDFCSYGERKESE